MHRKIKPEEITNALKRGRRMRALAIREAFAGLGRVLHLGRNTDPTAAR